MVGTESLLSGAFGIDCFFVMVSHHRFGIPHDHYGKNSEIRHARAHDERIGPIGTTDRLTSERGLLEFKDEVIGFADGNVLLPILVTL